MKKVVGILLGVFFLFNGNIKAQDGNCYEFEDCGCLIENIPVGKYGRFGDIKTDSSVFVYFGNKNHFSFIYRRDNQIVLRTDKKFWKRNGKKVVYKRVEYVIDSANFSFKSLFNRTIKPHNSRVQEDDTGYALFYFYFAKREYCHCLRSGDAFDWVFKHDRYPFIWKLMGGK